MSSERQSMALILLSLGTVFHWLEKTKEISKQYCPSFRQPSLGQCKEENMKKGLGFILALLMSTSALASFTPMGWSQAKIAAVLAKIAEPESQLGGYTIIALRTDEGPGTIYVELKNYDGTSLKKRFIVKEESCGFSACPLKAFEDKLAVPNNQ